MTCNCYPPKDEPPSEVPEPDDDCEDDDDSDCADGETPEFIVFVPDEDKWRLVPWLIAVFLTGVLIGALIFGGGHRHHDPVRVCPTTTTTTVVHASSSTVPTTLPHTLAYTN